MAEAQVDDRIEQLEQEADVVAADRLTTPQLTEDEPADAGPPQTGNEAVPALQLLDVNKVHSLWPADAPEIRVAVIDTGVSPTEPRVANKVVARVDPWYAPLSPHAGHGTTVASIIAADGESSSVVGLTPQATIVDAQMFRDNEQLDEFTIASLAQRLAWSIKQGARVLNMSFGDANPDRVVLAMLLKAEALGVVSVTSVGNCHEQTINGCSTLDQVLYPPGYDADSGLGFMITVGSITVAKTETTPAFNLTGSSSRNKSIDLVAPGRGLVVNCVQWDGKPKLKNSICSGDDAVDIDDKTELFLERGTSFAAPYVSATAALLLARHPDATPQQVREAIYESATCDEVCVADPNGWGHGILNPAGAAAALDQLLDSQPASGSADPEDQASGSQTPGTASATDSPTSTAGSASSGSTFAYTTKQYVGPITGNNDVSSDGTGPPTQVSIILIYGEVGSDYSGDLYLDSDSDTSAGKAGSVCSGKVQLTDVTTHSGTLMLTMQGSQVLWGPCPASITLDISLANPTTAAYADSSGGKGTLAIY